MAWDLEVRIVTALIGGCHPVGAIGGNHRYHHLQGGATVISLHHMFSICRQPPQPGHLGCGHHKPVVIVVVLAKCWATLGSLQLDIKRFSLPNCVAKLPWILRKIESFKLTRRLPQHDLYKFFQAGHWRNEIYCPVTTLCITLATPSLRGAMATFFTIAGSGGICGSTLGTWPRYTSFLGGKGFNGVEGDTFWPKLWHRFDRFQALMMGSVPVVLSSPLDVLYKQFHGAEFAQNNENTSTLAVRADI